MKTSRDDIVERAFPLFLKKGIDGLTMAELVAESGLSKGAFYYYFKDKASIYEACIDRFFDSFLPEPTDEPSSALAFIMALAEGYSRALEAAVEACGDATAYLRFVLSASEARRRRFAEQAAGARERIAGLLGGEGYSSGEAQAEARRILALLEGAGVIAALSHDAAKDEGIAEIVAGYLSKLGLRA